MTGVASSWRALRLVNRAMEGLEAASMVVTSVALFTIMIVIVVDVAARYFFKAPLAWSFDLISRYLMPAIFFLALSDTLHRNHHVNVDLLLTHLPPRLVRLLAAVGSALVIGIFAGIAWLAASHAWEDLQNRNVASGIIQWPTWLTQAFIALGAGVLTLRLALRAVVFAIGGALGRDDVPGADLPIQMIEEEL